MCSNKTINESQGAELCLIVGKFFRGKMISEQSCFVANLREFCSGLLPRPYKRYKGKFNCYVGFFNEFSKKEASLTDQWNIMVNATH